MLCVSTQGTLGSQHGKSLINSRTWTNPIKRIILAKYISHGDHIQVVERAAALALYLRDENKWRKRPGKK